MRAAPFALVVGNGLAMSFREHAIAHLASWDPREPLSWPVQTPGQAPKPFLEVLPYARDAVEWANKTLAGKSDFDKIGAIVGDRTAWDLHRSGDPLLATFTELRHYLAIAYSYFQLEADTWGVNNWKWAEWLRDHRTGLRMVVSFSYDLLAERLLSNARMRPLTFGVSAEQSGIPFLKPHGSIDFETHPATFFTANPSYPIRAWYALNDTPLIRLSTLSFVQPRREAGIVLPSETSPNVNLQWVEPGYAFFRNTVAKSISHCIFAGLSYWHCDRPEIDYLLESLPQGSTVISANPEPNPTFISKIEGLGLIHQQWWPSPEPLPTR